MKQVIRIPKDVELPLVGSICFGVIDRGTDLLQIRPTTVCPLNCLFCSVDAGPNSKTRATEYTVDSNYLIEWAEEIARYKGNYGLQMHIDFGDPTTYSELTELVQGLREIRGVETVSMETKSLLLNEEKIGELAKAGLTRVNLSLDSLDDEVGRKITGTESYDVKRITELARHVAKRMELLIAPVWVPGMNDEEIPKIIRFAKEVGIKLGIQKYEAHRFGRKPKGVISVTWPKFYQKLEEWERMFGVKLKISQKDFSINERKMLPIVFEKGKKVKVKIKAPGWMKGEMIGVAKDRCVTVVGSRAKVGDEAIVRILENKHNIYIGRIS